MRDSQRPRADLEVQSLLRCALCVMLLSCVVFAQRTWIVNAAGGGDFLDLPPAEAAASHGDTIMIVRTKVTPVSTSKGLTIFSVDGTFLVEGRFVVHDLPVGRRFRMIGFNSSLLFGGSVQLEFLRCKGRIEIVRAQGLRPNGATTEPYLKIEDCEDVNFDDCGVYAVSVVRSRVRFTRSSIRGNAPGFSSVNVPGILCVDSEIQLAECLVNGPASPYPQLPRPGIEMTRGRLLIAGDDNHRATWVANGITFGGPQRFYSPSIQSDGGVVVVDPNIWITDVAVPHLGTAGTSQFIFQPTSWTECPVTRVDGVFKPKMRVTAGALCALFVSAHSRPLPTPFGAMWLDPASLISLGSGVAQSTAFSHGEFSIPAPLPPGVFKQGESFTFQGISLTQGKLEFAVPATGAIMWPKL